MIEILFFHFFENLWFWVKRARFKISWKFKKKVAEKFYLQFQSNIYIPTLHSYIVDRKLGQRYDALQHVATHATMRII